MRRLWWIVLGVALGGAGCYAYMSLRGAGTLSLVAHVFDATSFPGSPPITPTRPARSGSRLAVEGLPGRAAMGTSKPGCARGAAGPGGSRTPGACRLHAEAAGTSIEVPRLGIHAPVHEGTVNAAGLLPIASGYSVTHFIYSGALGRPGNYVIYGHDDIDGDIFASLGSLRAGDRVYFHHGPHMYVYSVTGSEIVDPSDVAVLDPTSTPTLTMISCTPFDVDTQRIVVRAGLIGAR